MFNRIAVFIAIVGIMTMGISSAADQKGMPHGTEVAFVSGVQADLAARFPTVADATKAGYFRYTEEDHTGSISYVNLHWTSSDAKHPSQLWYDVNGNLLGADFSVMQSAYPTAPKIWGLDPSRWQKFGAHMHYVLAETGGKETYGYTTIKKFAAAGGNLDTPTAATIVKMGFAKNAAEVTHVFTFPAIWDLEVWVKSNPNGAFADMNPLVKPSASAEKSDM